MANLTGRQWREVTNMKAAPGSQGTLFQGGNPTPHSGGQPWPRGFSPERRRDVIGAMEHYPGYEWNRNARGWVGGNRGRAGRMADNVRAAETTRGVETLARSTVPAEQLRGTRFQFASTIADRGGNTLTSRGWYSRSDPKNLGVPVIHVVSGHAHESTVVHEVGHHVSATVDRNPHSKYDTPASRGQEEGYAENFAETHFRDRRGQRDLNFSTEHYGWSRREDDEGRVKFAAAFDTERRKSPSFKARRAAERADDDRELNPTGVKGQIPLLDRVPDGWKSVASPKPGQGRITRRHTWAYKHPDDDLGAG